MESTTCWYCALHSSETRLLLFPMNFVETDKKQKCNSYVCSIAYNEIIAITQYRHQRTYRSQQSHIFDSSTKEKYACAECDMAILCQRIASSQIRRSCISFRNISNKNRSTTCFADREDPRRFYLYMADLSREDNLFVGERKSVKRLFSSY